MEKKKKRGNVIALAVIRFGSDEFFQVEFSHLSVPGNFWALCEVKFLSVGRWKLFRNLLPSKKKLQLN